MHQDTEKSMSHATWQRLTERTTTQDWPCASLYVVATPIGNLADLSLRAWQTLLRCDVIAAEDTRVSRSLLDIWGINTPLIAAHQHNEAQAAQAIVSRLEDGERVALISDAGAPAISDPGARIVRHVRQAGYRVIPVPGPSAVIAALMGSGVTTDENPAFIFAGFMPPKSAARRQWLSDWCFLSGPVVMFESPHRLRASVADIADVCGADRLLTFARELSKRFEQIETMAAGQAGEWLSADAHRLQGEFVLIVHQQDKIPLEEQASPETIRLADALLESLSVRDAARILTKAGGMARDDAYKLALARSKA